MSVLILLYNERVNCFLLSGRHNSGVCVCVCVCVLSRRLHVIAVDTKGIGI